MEKSLRELATERACVRYGRNAMAKPSYAYLRIALAR